MPIFFPFYIGAAPATVAEEPTTPTTPARWTALDGTAKTWQAGPRAGIVPRFNRLYQQEAGAPQFVRSDDAVN